MNNIHIYLRESLPKIVYLNQTTCIFVLVSVDDFVLIFHFELLRKFDFLVGSPLFKLCKFVCKLERN